ncbi:MAG: Ku protein, partial [Chthoniobacterales bacterium]
TQTVDIINFVDLDEVNPLLFNKPYYMQAEKTGRKAYVLLRDALRKSNRIAMARVVIKTRQHLAAVKPQGNGLMLELMHFPDELRDTSEFESPADQKLAANEMKMALQLIDSMTEKWNPDDYTDEYRDSLQELIDKKVASGGKELPDEKTPTKRPSNVIDLAAVLQRSIEETSAKSGKSSSSKTRTRKKPATKSTRTRTSTKSKSTTSKSSKAKTSKKAA